MALGPAIDPRPNANKTLPFKYEGQPDNCGILTNGCDALAALAERPPAPGGDEVWVILTHPLRRRRETQIRSWLTVAQRCVSLLTDESLPEDLARVRQISDLLRSEAMPDGGRDVRLRVVHPQQRLDGPTLDFTPARLRARYEDGLRTARAGAALEV